ncbi:MAG: HAD family phosphatase, partial [Clostridia bacterium]|nr:HAD family phosphatase [Clostridia bacterium]
MKPLKPFQAAIFDLDGTLLDSLGVWTEVDRKFLFKRGIPVPPDYQHVVKTMNFPEAAEYTVARFALTESPAAIMSEWMQMTREIYATEVTAKPYAREYLQALSAKGVKLAVATSSTPELFLPALERNGIQHFFSAFVTTEEAGKGKRFPDVYLKAARRLNTEPHSFAVFSEVITQSIEHI